MKELISSYQQHIYWFSLLWHEFYLVPTVSNLQHQLKWHLRHCGRTTICKTAIHSGPLSGFSAEAVFFSTDPEHDFLVLKPWKTHTFRGLRRCQHRAIFRWHLDRSCASLHTYLFIFLLPEQCHEGRCPAHRKNNLHWKKGRGGGGKNIWICKSCHSVEPCEWEMLSPSFIMQRSLLNARQLGPASSFPRTPPNLSCHLRATRTKLQSGTRQHRSDWHTQMPRNTHESNYKTPKQCCCIWRKTL